MDLVTWCATGLAVLAVLLAGWQVWRARSQVQQARQHADHVGELATAAEGHAEQASGQAQRAHGEAKWAWEQVKLASGQLEEARQEHRASTRAEQWEWAYSLTKAARELVDAGQELIRVAFDPRVAPHYRLAADRHYRQACQRWQDTVIKAVARTSPPLELQQQVITFGHVHHRLHGHIDVLLRAAETDTLAGDTALAQQVFGLRQELAGAHRQLQRMVSASLATSESSSDETTTQHLTGSLTGNAAPGAADATHTSATPAIAATPHGQHSGSDDSGRAPAHSAHSSNTDAAPAKHSP